MERPRPRLSDVSSELVDFVITTFDVDAEQLARQLPAGIEVERFTLRDGRTRALVSAVSFLNTNFFVRFAPFVKLSCEQTNYRAYVKRGGARAVWFFGTGLASVFVNMPRHLWRLPWHRMHVERRSEWSDGTLRALHWHARAEGAEEKLDLRGPGRPLEQFDGFGSLADTHEVLTHPLEGYLRRRDERVVTYGVWHELLVVQQVEALEARFEKFEALGLVQPGQRPHSVLVQRATHFDVHLPPRPVT
jgi:hypothetical protein